ncbi:hypothetical protein MRB53_041573 [Persea americana]|nr:hypothetical protein MRB53_041573 [Persea americana]
MLTAREHQVRMQMQTPHAWDEMRCLNAEMCFVIPSPGRDVGHAPSRSRCCVLTRRVGPVVREPMALSCAKLRRTS